MFKINLFFPSPPMRILGLKSEVVFYGFTIGRIGIGFIRKTKRDNGSPI